jgi:hypothetical protein
MLYFLSIFVKQFHKMKAETQKLELIQWLAALKDKETLQALFFFKDIQQKTDWWDGLTEEQLSEINKGIRDIKEGRTVASSTVWKKYGRSPKR